MSVTPATPLTDWQQAHYAICGVRPLVALETMNDLAMKATASKHTSLADASLAMDAVEFVNGHCILRPAKVNAVNALLGEQVLQSTQMTFTFPWPPRLLSPNVPGHWAAKAQAKKAYRTACRSVVQQTEGVMPPIPPDGAVRVSMRFYPPNKRQRDWDNLMASMKAGLDGLADGLGCNDNLFRPAVEVADEIGGFVKVTVEVIE